MTNKRPYSNGNAGRAPAHKTQNTSAISTSPISSQTGSSSSVGSVAQGLKKTNHGVIFQLKLLILFLVRGIRTGQTFELGTAMEDIGGKFDDLIFKYEVSDTSDGSKRYRYRYLQAKHKQDEGFKITAAQLFNNTDGDFSLLKYFRSYCDIQSRGDDIEDCIICTNIGFDLDNFQKKGIQLKRVKPSDKMFTFGERPSIFKHFKITLEPNHVLREKLLSDCKKNSKWNPTDKNFGDFLDKLVFIANAPNEVVLGELLTEEIGEHFELHDANFVSDFTLRSMLDWFKKKESAFLTSVQGNGEILQRGRQKLESLYTTSVSISYQKELSNVIEFNDKAIVEMTQTLKTLFSLSNNKIERIKTDLPERTVVKLIAALKKFELYKRKDSYLMTSSEYLKLACEEFADTFKLNKFYQLLVVVCRDNDDEEDSYYENLIGDNQPKSKVIILYSNGVRAASDEIRFTDLSDECQKKLLGKTVSFQGTMQTVDDLIKNGNREEVIDTNSIEELLRGKKTVHIPEYVFNPGFDQDLYVERQLILPFDDKCFEALAAECLCTKDQLLGKIRVTVKNNIEWFIDGYNKSNMWQNVTRILRERLQSAHSSSWMDNKISEKDLTPAEEWINRVVVVSDAAGTGKSTILWNYYSKTKKAKPDNWIIKLDLVDYITAINQFNSDMVDQQSEAIKFFIANVPNVQESPLAQSLLRHRLKTGDVVREDCCHAGRI